MSTPATSNPKLSKHRTYPSLFHMVNFFLEFRQELTTRSADEVISISNFGMRQDQTFSKIHLRVSNSFWACRYIIRIVYFLRKDDLKPRLGNLQVRASQNSCGPLTSKIPHKSLFRCKNNSDSKLTGNMPFLFCEKAYPAAENKCSQILDICTVNIVSS